MNPGNEFSLEDIKAAHAKVKSGADFPRYVQDIIRLGVKKYETSVADGETIYAGKEDHKISSGAKYDSLQIADQINAAQFQSDLKAHQQGKTSYPVFCSDCARSGIEKWVVDMEAMTCTYFDKAGNAVLVETVPEA